MSAVLHMMHVWARKYPALVQFKGTAVKLPFAEVSWDGGPAALKAIFEEEKSLLELHAVPGAEPYKLMDLVKRFWGNIESAIDTLEDQKPNGFRFERRRTIRAWELMDMINAKPLNRPKEHRVEGTGGGWQLLADNVMTLFCSGLGDIIIPERHQQICPGWSPIPPMNDYMIANVASLRCLSGTCGKVRNGYIRLTDKLWLLQRPSCYMPAGCSHGPDERCDILLEIKAIQKKWLSHSLETPYGNGLPREGAVVIGKTPLFATLRNSNTSSVTYGKRKRSSANRINTCEAERSQLGLLDTGEVSSNFDWVDLGLENGNAETNDAGNASYSGTTDHNIDTDLVMQDELSAM